MVNFEPIRTDNPDINRLQQKLSAAFASVPALPTFQAASVTKNYKATGFEGVIHVDASRGPVRVTLPPPSDALPPLTVKQVNATGDFSSVTVVASGNKPKIAGQTSFALDDSGTGSVTFTSDGVQHWPSAGSSAAAASGGQSSTGVYVGKDPIQVVGNVISFNGIIPSPTPAPGPVTPWVAPASFGDGLYQDKTGAETWRAEMLVDFSAASSTLTLYWWFQALSSTGTAVFNLRIGGATYQSIAGPVAATWSETSPTLAGRSVVMPGIAAPVGVQRVALTCKSSAAAALAQIQGVNLLFK